jgi:hypothetical protein
VPSSAITAAGVRDGLDHSQKLLNFTFDEGGCFPSVRENPSVLTSRAGFMARTPFSVSQENSIRIAAMCCLTVGGTPGVELKDFDV